MYVIRTIKSYTHPKTRELVPMVSYYCCGSAVVQLCCSPEHARTFEGRTEATVLLQKVLHNRPGYKVVTLAHELRQRAKTTAQ